MLNFSLINDNASQANASITTTFLLLASACAVATIITFVHCLIRCENQERARYAIIIMALPVLGSILYWKDRPDIFGYGILMAYPPKSKEKKNQKNANPAVVNTQKFASQPVATQKPGQAPRYSSPPFNVTSAKNKQIRRTSNVPALFDIAKTKQGNELAMPASA